MAHWLVKSEPDSYSWEQLEKDKETCWSGVRNYAARGHLKNMKKGDEVFFYHSNEGTDIVGIAKVIKEIAKRGIRRLFVTDRNSLLVGEINIFDLLRKLGKMVIPIRAAEYRR